MNQNDVPLGLGFALAQNPEAMKIFSNLSDAARAALLQKAHNVSSKAEMQSLVHTLVSQKQDGAAI